jgi:PEGA domain
MKKIFLLFTILVIVFLLNACNSNDNPTTPINTKGNLFISSSPVGAQIWLDGVNTNQVTPDTVKDIEEGTHNFTLKLTDYDDTTFTVSITAEQTGIVGPIILVSNIEITLHGPVRIYESFNTPASEPSGLDLSSGNAWGISSDSSGVVDIYYYSDQSGTSYLIQSANIAGLVRTTYFHLGSSTNLYDEVDSPAKDNSWGNSIDESEDNYVFLYDHDGHYSKLKIVNRGGGTGLGDPAWVDVQWYYNEKLQDKRF